MFMYQLAS